MWGEITPSAFQGVCKRDALKNDHILYDLVVLLALQNNIKYVQVVQYFNMTF